MRIALLLFFYSLSAIAAQEDQFALSKKWLNLLYYEKVGSSFQSRVENDTFFIDRKNGMFDPAAELKAEVETFQATLPASDQHPQCLFPSRYMILKGHYKLAPPVRCPQFSEWMEAYEPAEIVLVYASQYISNPASAMGHAFLMIPSKKQTQGFWLTYNYAAAIPANVGALKYIWGGLTGDFLGDFSVMPLYQRLEQYGAIENRDLWFYTLKASPEEKELFIKHLWELVHNSHFRYYFKDENCSGILLRTFAAIFDDLQFANQLDFQVPPIEAVKTAYRNGRVASFEFFPSKTNSLRTFLDQIPKKERDQFYAALKDPVSYAAMTEESPHVSEGLLMFLGEQRRKNDGTTPDKWKGLEREAIRKRSQSPVPPLKLDTTSELPFAPHLSHQPSQWSVGALFQQDRKEHVELGYRFTFHSLLDADAGFLKNSGMEILKFKMSFSENTIHLKQLTLIQIENFQPNVVFDPRFSWRISTGLKEAFLNPVSNGPLLYGALGGGMNREWFGQYEYLMLAADLNVGGAKKESGVELGPELGTILTFNRFKTALSSMAQYGLVDRTPGWHLRLKVDTQWNLRTNSFVGLEMRREDLLDLRVLAQQAALRFGMQF